MKTLLNKNLLTIKPDFKGNVSRDDRFLNYQKVPVPKFRDILRWKLGENPQKHEKQNDPFLLNTFHDDDVFNKEKDKIVWLGHASFLITLNGKNILTDPVFSDIGLIKRRAKIPFSNAHYTDIDYILISHSHYDHLDKKTVTALATQNPKLKIYCGLNTKTLLQKWRIKNEIVEAAWYQQFPVFDDELLFYFMPSLHWSSRTLFDRNKRLWGSFIIKNKKTTIYFMGDSGYSPHFSEIAEFFPDIGYAILGVGAYMPRHIMQSSHLNPEEARQAFLDLKAKYIIPMHYATYDLTDEPYEEPIRRTKTLFSLESEKLKVLEIGRILLV